MITHKPAEELHKLYLSKRTFFSDQVSKSSNEIIRQKLFHCTSMVELCLQTMIALSEALPGVMKFYQREIDQAKTSDAEMVSHLQNMTAAARQKRAPYFKR